MLAERATAPQARARWQQTAATCLAATREAAAECAVSLLDLVAPSHCLSCGQAARGVLCASCHGRCEVPSGPACPQCGAPWSRARAARSVPGQCGRCRRWGQRFDFDFAVALYRYRGPPRELVRALKFRGAQQAAVAGGRWMAADPRCAAPALAWGRDVLVVNVPARAASRRQRGYDQAECLAASYAAALRREHAPSALRRLRQTGPQVGRSRAVRRAAVAGAFAARELLVLDRPVVLVDDVLSTGASADACSRALRLAGARAVAVVAFAT